MTKKCDNCRYKKMCYRRINPIGDKYSHTDNCEHYEEYEQRPHGKWVQVTARDGEYYCYHKCTNCGQTIESGFDRPPLFNFCPNCGARMKEGDEK